MLLVLFIVNHLRSLCEQKALHLISLFFASRSLHCLSALILYHPSLCLSSLFIYPSLSLSLTDKYCGNATGIEAFLCPQACNTQDRDRKNAAVVKSRCYLIALLCRQLVLKCPCTRRHCDYCFSVYIRHLKHCPVLIGLSLSLLPKTRCKSPSH